MYIFGHLEGHSTPPHIYDYVVDHWREWFPALPSYQAFDCRVNQLAPAFELLIHQQMTDAGRHIAETADRLIDSLPIMLAVGTRANRARVARELADTGFCATKQIHYRGVKLHLMAARRSRRLPLPKRFSLSRASQHDLTALRELNPTLGRYGLFADKAYADALDEGGSRFARNASAHAVQTTQKRAGNEHPGFAQSLRFEHPSTVGESLRLDDSKNRFAERITSAFD